LCWTEAPASYKILGRQRNRWTRGPIETLSMHRKMCFNPRYGRLGLLSFPSWLFFELFAPIVEFLGLAASVVIYLFGGLNLVSFLTLLGFILSFGILFSVLAILMEVLTFNQYKDSRDILRLVLTALLEPFLFHPFIVWSAIRGNIDLLRKKKGWGEMSRQGFTANKAKVYAKS
jgi:cellulose synthase/poly-beta-1,6-N-acetylglucosamine synthase-like glycosyltransferase